MKSNYTLEEVNGFLDSYQQVVFGLGCSSNSYLEQFKKDKGLIPTLEVGKWLKDLDNGFIFFVTTDATEKVTAKGYGFSDCGHWFSDDYIGYTTNRQATTEEVETALKAEAIKRGYKEGIRFSNKLFYAWSREAHLMTSNKIDYIDKSLSVTGEGGYTGAHTIYSEGKWAEIVETKVLELTMSELEDKYGCKVKIIKE